MVPAVEVAVAARDARARTLLSAPANDAARPTLAVMSPEPRAASIRTMRLADTAASSTTAFTVSDFPTVVEAPKTSITRHKTVQLPSWPGSQREVAAILV
jgi:hypothetical protein